MTIPWSAWTCPLAVYVLDGKAIVKKLHASCMCIRMPPTQVCVVCMCWRMMHSVNTKHASYKCTRAHMCETGRDRGGGSVAGGMWGADQDPGPSYHLPSHSWCKVGQAIDLCFAFEECRHTRLSCGYAAAKYSKSEWWWNVCVRWLWLYVNAYKVAAHASQLCFACMCCCR